MINRTTLTAAPEPSVVLHQLWIIEITDTDVEHFGATPDLFRSIWPKITGPIYLETTNPSALEKQQILLFPL